jgi:IclR helix-turn-helix domain
MPEEKVRQTPFIQSLDHGLTILQAVALSKQPVSLGELTELLGIDRSSAFRLANTLRRRGFLACPAGRKDYILGSSMWRLSHRYAWGNMLIRVADKQLHFALDKSAIQWQRSAATGVCPGGAGWHPLVRGRVGWRGQDFRRMETTRHYPTTVWPFFRASPADPLRP